MPSLRPNHVVKLSGRLVVLLLAAPCVYPRGMFLVARRASAGKTPTGSTAATYLAAAAAQGPDPGVEGCGLTTLEAVGPGRPPGSE